MPAAQRPEKGGQPKQTEPERNRDQDRQTIHRIALFNRIGIDIDKLSGKPSASRRVLCRPCLDWSERRTHLAGSLGEALLVRVFDLGWARREKESRVVTFTRAGESALTARFRLRLTATPH